eukprot:TRINITY_DN11738_c0_g1_i1.p1 TRINITY_DN11738_c0_g1~~TRINITY_DN11738_c0_g1_i1.p1  ORF type:complete len:1660 (+),score=374.61 TRINITY_DN11738_c0_g1_i1:224-5203(+)
MADHGEESLSLLRNNLAVPRASDGGDSANEQSRPSSRLASRSNSRRQSFFTRVFDPLNMSMIQPSQPHRLRRDRLASSMPDIRVAFDWCDDAASTPEKESISPMSRTRQHRSFRMKRGTSHRGRAGLQASSKAGSPRRLDSPNPEDWRSGISRRASNRGSKRLTSPHGSRRHRDTVRDRARSLSPERQAPESSSLNKALLEAKYNDVVKQVSRMMTVFLSMLAMDEEQDAPSTHLGLVSEQLRRLVTDVLKQSQNHGLNLSYLEEVNRNLIRLLEHCTPEDPAAAHIRRLLVILERPARLLKCLEYNPKEQQELSDDEAQAKLMDLMHTDRQHMPSYVLSRITTSFGPAGMEVEDERTYKQQQDNTVEFLKNGETPTKHDFDLKTKLSSGAFGSVWMAYHVRTKEQVAIKILRKQEMINKNVVAQVMAERDILQFARNPFLINMYCSFTTKNWLYIVMEYAPGGDLATYLKAMTYMELKEARRYFAETVLAVEYIHDFGIIHRDIKPDNLIIGQDGHIKLTDFGLSQIGLMSATTRIQERDSPEAPVEPGADPDKPKQVLGTPDYIAPEVILGQTCGKAVDWWSMGVILYEFLIGEPPFYADTVDKIFERTINDEVEFPVYEDPADDTLTPEVKDLIRLLLEKDPSRRLGTPPPPSHLASWEQVMPGAFYVKDHDFFYMPVPDDEQCIDWDNLLLEKANFVPQLDDENDTSHFDSREERYNHGYISSSSDEADSDSASNSGSDAFRDFVRVNPHSASNTPLPGASPTMARTRRASRAAYYLDPFEASLSPHRLVSAALPSEPDSPDVRPKRNSSHFPGSSRDRVREEARRSSFTRSAPTTPPLTKAASMFNFPSPGASPTSIKPPLPRASSSTTIRARGLTVPQVAVIESKTPPGNDDEVLLGLHRLPAISPQPPLALDDTDNTASNSNCSSLAPSTGNSRNGSLHGVLDPAILARLSKEELKAGRSDSAVGTTSSTSPVSTDAAATGKSSKKQLKVRVEFDPKDGFGFTLRNSMYRSVRKHKIIQVMANSVADKAGLKPGMSILKINNEDVTTMPHQQVSRLVRRAQGSAIVMEVETSSKKRLTSKIGARLKRSFRRSDRNKPRNSPSPAQSPSNSLNVKSPPSSLRKARNATSNLSTEALFDNLNDSMQMPSPPTSHPGSRPGSRPSSREGTLLSGLGLTRSSSDSNRQRSNSGSNSGGGSFRRSSWRRSRRQGSHRGTDKNDISSPQDFKHLTHVKQDADFVDASEANEIFAREGVRASTSSSVFTPTASTMGAEDAFRDDYSVSSSNLRSSMGAGSMVAMPGTSPLSSSADTPRHTSPRRTSIIKESTKRSSPLTSPARTPPNTPRGHWRESGANSPETHSNSQLRHSISPRTSLHSGSDAVGGRLARVRSMNSPKSVRSPLGMSPRESRRGSFDLFGESPMPAIPSTADQQHWENVVRSADAAMSESFSETSSLAPTSPRPSEGRSPQRSHVKLYRPPARATMSAPVSPMHPKSTVITPSGLRDLNWTPMPPSVSSRLASRHTSAPTDDGAYSRSALEREASSMTSSEAHQQLAAARRASRQATSPGATRRRSSRSPSTRLRTSPRESMDSDAVLQQAAASPVRALRLAGHYAPAQPLTSEDKLSRDGSNNSLASSLAESVDFVRRGLDKETIV